uniref:Uncharacterized protein n=1 Tax=viral metagenome TaxID=1070528 RepID=A0A6C0HC21_9ZZZZ
MQPEIGVYFLYVILLEGDNIGLHASTETDMEKVKIEFEIMNDFAKLHKPIAVTDMVEIGQDFALIDLNVKKYMKEYGIQRVRGGSYSMVILPTYLKFTLELELKTLSNYAEEYLEKTKGIFDIEEYQNEEYLKKELQKYMLSKNKYELCKYIKDENGELYEIHKETLIKELEWVIEKIHFIQSVNKDLQIYETTNGIRLFKNMTTGDMMSTHAYFELSQENKMKYQYIINKIKGIIQIYFKLYQDDEDVITKYKYHKTIVDENVFKVSHYIDANYIEELIKNTELFVYSIINRLDEFEFDLSTYPPNFETNIKNKIYFLQNKHSALSEFDI